MIKRRQDFVLAFIVIAFGTATLVLLPRVIAKSRSRFSDIGPLFFPTFLLIILIILGAVLFLQSFTAQKPTNPGKGSVGRETNDRSPLATIAQDHGRRWVPIVVYILMLVYSLVVERFGFVVSTVVVMVTLMLIIGERRWLNFVAMILVVLLIRFVFQDLLNVVLP